MLGVAESRTYQNERGLVLSTQVISSGQMKSCTGVRFTFDVEMGWEDIVKLEAVDIVREKGTSCVECDGDETGMRLG